MSKFIDKVAALEFISIEANKKGLFSPEEQLEFVNSIVEQIPPTTKPAYMGEGADAEDPYVLAANYFPTWTKNVNEPLEGAGALDLQTQTKEVAKKDKEKAVLRPRFSDAETAAIAALLKQDDDWKMKKTVGSSIKALLVRAPKPSVLYKGLKGVIATAKLADLQLYRNIIVEDEKGVNKAALEKAITACEKQTPVAVHIDDEKRAYKGVIVSTPVVKEGKTVIEEIIMSPAMLESFLFMDVWTRIPSKDGLGVEATNVTAKTGKARQSDNTRVAAKAVLKWDGKQAVIKSGDANRVVAISEVKADEKRDNVLLPLDIAFEVYVGEWNADKTEFTKKKDQKNKFMKKTIRVRGSVDGVPVLKRIEKYANIFGEEKNGTTIFAKMGEEDKKKALSVAVMYAEHMSSEATEHNPELKALLDTLSNSAPSTAGDFQ